MTAVAAVTSSRRRSNVLRAARLLWQDKPALAALLILVGVGVVAIFAHELAPHDPNLQDIPHRLMPPSWHGHLLGTDELGRDNLSRIMEASRVSVVVALSVVAITMTAGTAIGVLAGFVRGKVDYVIMGVTDSVMAFPGLLMILIIATVLGAGLRTIIIALAVTFWTTYARMARGLVLSLRESDHIAAARSVGMSELRIVRVHLLPFVVPQIASLIPLEMGRVMLNEASVSFLGLGIQPPMISWGTLIADGHTYFITGWWLITFPGIALFLTILAANTLGSWFRLAVDPRHRSGTASWSAESVVAGGHWTPWHRHRMQFEAPRGASPTQKE